MSEVSRQLAARHANVRRVLLTAFCVNIVIVVAKMIAGLSAHSLSVVADAAHSSVDAFNNMMGLALARVASKEPDAEHPYGHAKFETLGALGIVAFLSVTVFELVTSAAHRLLGSNGEPHATPLVVGVMLASAGASFFMARYAERSGRRYHSEILIADAQQTKSDVYAALAVLIGIAVVVAGYPSADAFVTLLVAFLIARAGLHIVQTTVPILVDERAVDEDRIARIALDTPGVLNSFAVRSRGRTGEIFAELTITVAPTLNVAAAHLIADAVERRVADAVGAREVVVHVEPESHDAADVRNTP